ncbi:MFS transporter [Catellatospora citrea]|uniref:Putative multidrug-efflux transporter n=1 Tax=Catellatospora citrea TaxID=53366 RepID=A0A8J3P176_9ACTN|nr:MFS transporter [Catellatospora citrea]RKE11415.1 putative MFS family arabinose efflux permease [Catellatospora citrea]GIF99912.1 putative multidrug-efflux transporter [Catellatospora citrea]
MKRMRNGARSWIGSVGRLGRHPALRWILPAQLVSALGDGMSMVAVAWLAVQIAPAGQAGVWTGLAVAAYALPAPLGAALLAWLMRRLRAAQLVAADASVRAVALGTVAVLAVTGLLDPVAYVALLAVSSLLHAWGSAGVYTLVAEVLPEDDQVIGNALLSTFAQSAFVVGPGLAGGLTALAGPGWVIGVDAVSFAVLAVAAWALAARQASTAATAAGSPEASATGGWRVILDRPRLLGLLAVTCAFFFLYGPVEVALPVHVAHGLHGSPGLLGLYWTVFGIGATVGSLGAVLLRHRAPWRVVVVIVVGWGAALLPLGLTDAVAPGLVGFAAGGLVYGPFTAISTALFQRGTPPHVLSRVLAARSALTAPATGLGTLVGGPVVTAVGGRPTLLISALLTIALGLSVAAVLRLSRRAAGTGPAVAPTAGRAAACEGRLVAAGAAPASRRQP